MLLMEVLRQGVLLCITLVGLFIYLLVSGVKQGLRLIRPSRRRRRILERRMAEARSYQEWERYARDLDLALGNNEWKINPTSPYYDAQGIADRLAHLRDARERQQPGDMLQRVQENLVRGLCGLGKEQLYTKCTTGTKVLIEDYIDEVAQTIQAIAANSDIPWDAKERFLANARQAYGRSALLLSGGVSMGMYHWGVVKCLFENNLLPRVLCGSSVGALVVAILGKHTDEQLLSLLSSDMPLNFGVFERLDRGGSAQRKLKRFLKYGHIMDVGKLEEFCRANLGDVTFQEAYEMTGRLINITIPHTPLTKGLPTLLNYLTTPNVLLWSAACASCSQPGLYAPVNLMAKDFGGSIVCLFPTETPDQGEPYTPVQQMKLPMKRLSELFNVNYFVVSQVNPQVLPFLRSKRSTSRFGYLHRLMTFLGGEVLHGLVQLAELRLLPRRLRWIEDELLAKYEGHMTIVPQVSLASLLRSLSNPSKESLGYCTQMGFRSTFPYVSMLKTCYRIERTLNMALRSVRGSRPPHQPQGPTSPPDPLRALAGTPVHEWDIPLVPSSPASPVDMSGRFRQHGSYGSGSTNDGQANVSGSKSRGVSGGGLRHGSSNKSPCDADAHAGMRTNLSGSSADSLGVGIAIMAPRAVKRRGSVPTSSSSTGSCATNGSGVGVACDSGGNCGSSSNSCSPRSEHSSNIDPSKPTSARLDLLSRFHVLNDSVD
eukprot:m.487458 g.487458  ORF g.487458 m.487458 type:complete len:713 (+) comp25031_c0_seq1:209-2347(+)